MQRDRVGSKKTKRCPVRMIISFFPLNAPDDLQHQYNDDDDV